MERTIGDYLEQIRQGVNECRAALMSREDEVLKVEGDWDQSDDYHLLCALKQAEEKVFEVLDIAVGR